MNANDLFPSKFLCAEDLDSDTVVTMKGISKEKVGKKEEIKPVMHLEEYPKAMVLNKTKVKRIKLKYGKETEDWWGKQITLYPSETEYEGEDVPCIRVRKD